MTPRLPTAITIGHGSPREAEAGLQVSRRYWTSRYLRSLQRQPPTSMEVASTDVETTALAVLVPTGRGRAQRVGEKWYVDERGHAVRVIMFVKVKLEAGKGPARG